MNILGTCDVARDCNDRISAESRLVIMLFDTILGRTVGVGILEIFSLPQDFSIGAVDAMPGIQLKGPYSLRIISDKNDHPFESAPGELIVRSKKLLPLGSQGLNFVLDQEYLR